MGERRRLIWRTRELGENLNTFRRQKDWRQESESVTIINSFGGKVEMSWRDSIIAKFSAVQEDAVDGRLLEK